MSGEKKAGTFRLIFDSNALITMCKFPYQSNPLVGIITDLCEVTIPRSVAKETTRAKESFKDARIAARFIRSKKIKVDEAETTANTFLDDYKLGKGEKEAIFLYLAKEKEFDYFVTDDRLVYIVCDRMGIPKSLFLDLIIKLVKQRAMEADLAKRIIGLIKPRYSKGFVSHSLVLLEEVKESVEAENLAQRKKVIDILKSKYGDLEGDKEKILEFAAVGFEERLTQLYEEFRRGEISLEHLAEELGLTVWEVAHLLDERGLKSTNL